jgi:hypothetical protein
MAPSYPRHGSAQRRPPPPRIVNRRNVGPLARGHVKPIVEGIGQLLDVMREWVVDIWAEVMMDVRETQVWMARDKPNYLEGGMREMEERLEIRDDEGGGSGRGLWGEVRRGRERAG